MASGSGAVGKAVVSDTRDPCFESGHRQLYLLLNVSNKLHRKDEKIKRGQNGQFFMQKVKALSIGRGDFCNFCKIFPPKNFNIFLFSSGRQTRSHASLATKPFATNSVESVGGMGIAVSLCVFIDLYSFT